MFSSNRVGPASWEGHVRPVPYAHLGAFESTRIVGSGTDILATTRHYYRWRHDLELLRAHGIQELRYSAPWHRIEPAPGKFDFSWMDGPMGYMEQHAMDPIVDPLHHVSFPEWLDGGFANPEFPSLYARFAGEFACRYPFVRRYTVFNEPLPTTLHCSLIGTWYPHQSSERHFTRMAVNVSRAISLATAELRRVRPDAVLVHVDTAEHHTATDSRSEEWVAFANQRRYLFHDLVLGKVEKGHPLLPYLHEHGFTSDDMEWLKDHRAPFDLLGLDYYTHCEMDWYWDSELGRANISAAPEAPLGFAAVATEYHTRFGTPLVLTETNLRGTPQDRLTWLRFMEEQCERLTEAGIPFEGFCWYPSIDSTDWCNLCTKATCSVDPQGIWSLDDRCWERYPSELSAAYGSLAKGQIGWRELPAYRFSFSDATHQVLPGYLKLMNHWTNWKEPGEAGVESATLYG